MLAYKWIALSNTSLGMVMGSLDGNIVIIAFPTIGRELPQTTPIDLIWILLGYQLVTTCCLVNFGRLSDMFGRTKLYTFGFGLFTIGSALCSLSQTGHELAVFRIVQGMGAAFIFSNSAAIITDAFPVEERGKALGIGQVSLVVGSVSGLVLGGILTSTLGWQSIFWVNIPIGIFATLWAHFRLRELATITAGQKIDAAGNITFATSLFAILASVTLYAFGTLDFWSFAALLGFGAALFAAFFFIETKVKYPMIRLSLFKIRFFSAWNAAILLNALGRGAFQIVLSLYLQGPTMGLAPIAAGIILIPNSASLSFFGPISGLLSDRYGPRILAPLGCVVSAAGFLMLGNIGNTSSFLTLLVPLILVGGGFGIFASPNRSAIMSSVPADIRGLASGITTTFINLGMVVSIAVAFVVMSFYIPVPDIQSVLSGTLTVRSTSWASQFIMAVRGVNYISAVLMLVSVVPSLVKPGPRDGSGGGADKDGLLTE